MRVKKIRGAMKTLFAIDRRIGRSRWRKTESSQREHAPGLTPRQIIDKFRSVKMVDVVMPTTDGVERGKTG